MTTPESGRDPSVVLRADVAQYLASMSAAERATLRLSTSIQRDMRGAATSINQATAALRAYVTTAQTVGVRIPAARTGGATTAASNARVARDASGRFTAQQDRAGAALARASRQRDQDTARSANHTADVMEKAADRIGDSFEDMARKVKITGAILAAGLFVSAKAAIEWETAWTGVRKTVDGSPEQLAKLEGELRKLATTLPTTHKEIAGVAEAAGQMGVEKENIADFTKTVVELAATTNLTADAAATGLAKFTNVMGTLPSQTKRVASTIVALGNAGASTEADIVAMAQRISGAGKTIGLTEGQVLALSSATSDLGVEAELGGGALQRVMLDTYKAVKQGGDELERFAGVARDASGAQMTGTGFADLFNSNPAAALQSLIRGLREVQDQGGNTVAAMNAIGAEGTLDISVLTRLTGGIDVLNDALDTSAKAWRQPLDLLEEMEKRAGTTASKIQVARSQFRDLAIDVGGALLPDIAGVAGGLQDAASAAQKVPGPLGTIALESVKAVAMLTLLSTALLLVAGKIALSITVANALARTMPRLAGAITFLQKRFVLLAASIAALGAADVGIKKWTASIDAATGRRADLAALRRSMLDLLDASKEAEKAGDASKGIKATGEAARLWGASLKGLAKDLDGASNPSWGDRFNKLAVSIENVVSKPFGFELGTAGSDLDRTFGRVNDLAEASERLGKGLDQGLADIVERVGAPEAVATLEVFADQLATVTGQTVPEAIDSLLKGMDKAAGGSSKFVEEYHKSRDAADLQSRANKKLGDSAKEAGDGMTVAALDAEAFEKAVKKITPGWLDLDEALLTNAQRWQDIRDEAQKTQERLQDVTDTAADVAQEMLDSRDRTDAYADSLKQLAEGAEDSFDRVRDAATAGIDDALETGEAYDQLATSITGVQDALADGSIDASLLGMGEAAIKGRQSVAGLVKEAGALVKSMIPAGASVEQVGEITQRVGGDLEQSLISSGLNPQVVQQLLSPLRSIPGEYAKAAAEVRKEAEKAAKEELGAATEQAVEVAKSRIRPGASPDEVDAIVGEEADRVRRAGSQRGIDPRVIEESIAPLGRLAQGYRDAAAAEVAWQQSQDRVLEKRVEFGDMLKERLEALKAYNLAAQTDKNITPEDQTKFALQQKQELEVQLRAKGATPEQIAEFTKPITDLMSSVANPQVDNTDVLKKNDQSILSGQTAQAVNNWKAKPEVDTSGVEDAYDKLGAVGRAFLDSPEGKAWVATQDKGFQDRIAQSQRPQAMQRPTNDQGVAGAPAIGPAPRSDPASGGSPWFRDDVTAFGQGLRHAGGGRISGPGGSTDDKVPAYLSNGEFVINAAVTSQWLPLLNMLNAGNLPPGLRGQLMAAVGGGARVAGFNAPGRPKTKLMYGSHVFDPFGAGLKYQRMPGRGLGPYPGALQGLPRRPGYAGGGLVDRKRDPVMESLRAQGLLLEDPIEELRRRVGEMSQRVPHTGPLAEMTNRMMQLGGSWQPGMPGIGPNKAMAAMPQYRGGPQYSMPPQSMVMQQAPAAAGPQIDYNQLAAAMARVSLTVQGQVTMDGRQVGTLMGRQSDLRARGY